MKKYIKKNIYRLMSIILDAMIGSLREDKKVQMPEHSCIVAFWHEELPASIKHFSYQGVVTLASSSDDGEIVSRITERRGAMTYRGSSNKSPVASLLRILRELNGRSFANAVDGPRGPRREFKKGIGLVAQKTGVPIYCVRMFYKGVRLRTWDRLLVPFPFTKIHARWSKPIYINPSDDIDSKIRDCEEAMLSLGDPWS